MPSTQKTRLKGVRYPLDHDPRALRLRRIELGMTQQEVADRAGIAKSTVCELETGTRNPSVRMLRLLSGALECQIRDLMARPITVTPAVA